MTPSPTRVSEPSNPKPNGQGDTITKGYHDYETGLRPKRSDTAGKVAPTWWFCFSAPLPEAWPPLSPVPPLALAPPAPYNEKTPSPSVVAYHDRHSTSRMKNYGRYLSMQEIKNTNLMGVNRVTNNQIYGIL